MLFFSCVLSIVIGYLFKGNLRNFEHIKISMISLIFAGFFIDMTIILLIKEGVLERGSVTLALYIIEYCLLFLFTYLNRHNVSLVIMGAGFLMNALPIFLNGGVMPCSESAIKLAGLSTDVAKKGLFILVDHTTKLWFLGDVIPLQFFIHTVISFGDIITAIGIMLFIISGMKAKMHTAVTNV